jgi:hypothetical protein
MKYLGKRYIVYVINQTAIPCAITGPDRGITLAVEMAMKMLPSRPQREQIVMTQVKLMCGIASIDMSRESALCKG